MPPEHSSASTSTSPRLLVYIFLLSGRSRSPTQKIAVSFLSRSPLGHANMSFIPFPSLNPTYIFEYSSLSSFRLHASCFHISIVSLPFVLFPPNPPMDFISSWFPPMPFYTFSTTPSHLIPAYPFVIFFHTAINFGWQSPCIVMFLTLYCRVDPFGTHNEQLIFCNRRFMNEMWLVGRSLDAKIFA